MTVRRSGRQHDEAAAGDAVVTDAPRPPHRPSRRAELIAAAIAEFGRPPAIDSVTTAQVAARTDMGESAVFYHFASTDELLKAVIDELFTGIDARFARAPDEGTRADWLTSVMERQIAWMRGAPDEARLLVVLSSASPRGREILAAVHNRLNATTRALATTLQLVRDDIAPLHAEIVARALFSLIIELADSAYGPDQEPRQSIETLTAAALIVAHRLAADADEADTDGLVRELRLADG
jgi:AcrR family transcriptional regulator